MVAVTIAMVTTTVCGCWIALQGWLANRPILVCIGWLAMCASAIAWMCAAVVQP